ncbi:MAG TPA: alkaline phosphatase family protein [Anaerohalosphaeraceae bacterium]|nr:alkaline phosphatase family protein [Anaerohalosphaeraceae bacterium]HOL88373.1 alkaline phosphatase family protein [Anaerohalosphaeraceae bacterium]HPP55025.1 alkaline phosphatase family protein [Anaerohalosphaeraceae bacterium]
MLRTFLLNILAAALLGTSLSADVRNVIVIGWDGAQRNHVKEMIARNELPSLIALCKEGRLIDIDVTDGATDTKAGWTQILTGYSCSITGVYNNTRYQPIPEGYSVFERLESHFGPDKIDTVAVIGKKNHVGNAAPKKIPYTRFEKQLEQKKKGNPAAAAALARTARIFEENGEKFALIPGEPWYSASRKMDLFVNGLSENEKVAERALEEIEKRKDRRFFLFIHFAQPDHAGHQYGENSQEYTKALRDDDLWTGRIVAKLKELGLYEKTLVYVVVDHGFDEGQKSHSYAPYVFLGTNDPAINRDGDRADIAPTILKRFGMDLSKISPLLTGVPLDEPAPRKIAPAEKPAAKARSKKTKDQPLSSLGKNSPALEKLRTLDVNDLTPIEAVNLLKEIKKEME